MGGTIAPILQALVAQTVKNLPAVRETRVQSLGQKDPLEKGMTTHSNILAWRIPWTEKPGALQSMGLQESDNDLATESSTAKTGAAQKTGWSL